MSHEGFQRAFIAGVLLGVPAVGLANDDGPVEIFIGPLVNGVGTWPNASAIERCSA